MFIRISETHVLDLGGDPNCSKEAVIRPITEEDKKYLTKTELEEQCVVDWWIFPGLIAILVMWGAIIWAILN